MAAAANQFKRYYENRIYEWIETEDESDLIENIFCIVSFDEWMNARGLMYEKMTLDDSFKTTHLCKVGLKALVAKRGELERAGRFNTQQATSVSWGDILGGLFKGVMTDYYAYNNLNPNNPSMSYIENKMKASVLWDLFGRR